MKKLFIILISLPGILFSQQSNSYEAFGEMHNLFCIKAINDNLTTNNIAEKYANAYYYATNISNEEARNLMTSLFPETKTYLNNIDNLMNIAYEVEDSVFLELWEKNRVSIEQELKGQPKHILLYMLSVVKHSKILWERLLPNRKTRQVLISDAYGAIKGILAGLLFFAIYDFTKMPSQIGTFGGVGLAITITSVSSLITAIKQRNGSSVDWYY